MPIDLMALAEGGPAKLPGRKSSGSGKNIFANKELLAKYEQAASPEKPQEESPRRKSWTPPAKPADSDRTSNAGVRNLWDPPKPTSPARGAGDPAKPPPIISVRSCDKVDDEMPVSPRLSDNPFVRRDSNSGLRTSAPTSPSAKSAPRDIREHADPVVDEMNISNEAKAKAEAAAKQAAAEEAKAAAEAKATAQASVAAEVKAATQIQAIAKGNGTRKAEVERMAAKPEPVATAAASGGDAQTATGDAGAVASSPQKQLEQLEATEADEAKWRAEALVAGPWAPTTAGATSPKAGAKEKEKRVHRLSGSNLLSLLTPRSRRSSRDLNAA